MLKSNKCFLLLLVDRFVVVARFDWWAGWRVRDSQHQPSCDRNRLVVSYRGLTSLHMGLLLQNQEQRLTKMISFLLRDPCKPCQCYWEEYLYHPKRYATMPVVLFHRPRPCHTRSLFGCWLPTKMNQKSWDIQIWVHEWLFSQGCFFPFAKPVLYSFDHRNVGVFFQTCILQMTEYSSVQHIYVLFCEWYSCKLSLS